MPARLDEINSLSFLNPTSVANITDVRYANPPPPEDVYKNWTMIEDIPMSKTCTTILPPNTQSPQWMPNYNSNAIIPSYNNAVCPSSAQQFINNVNTTMNASQSFMQVTNQPGMPSGMIPITPYPIASALTIGHTVLPTRTVAPSDIVASNNAALVQYSVNMPNPPFAGSIPPMQNAVYNDVTVPMVPQHGMIISKVQEPYVANEEEDVQEEKETRVVKSKEKRDKQPDCEGCCSNHISRKWFWMVFAILIIIIMICLYYINKLKKAAPVMTRLYH